jgi:hypothetical protein
MREIQKPEEALAWTTTQKKGAALGIRKTRSKMMGDRSRRTKLRIGLIQERKNQSFEVKLEKTVATDF